MSPNFDFTDKTEETLAAAIQLAKDYANAQGKHPLITLSVSLLIFSLVNSCTSSYRVRALERRC